MQNFNEWFLTTTRNQEFIELVLFLNSQTPAEELEREAGTTLKVDTGICHWFLFQSSYLWGAQIIQVPNHHNTGQKSFYEARKPSRIAPGLNDSFCSALCFAVLGICPRALAAGDAHVSESALLTDLEESTNISPCLLDLTGQKLNTNNGRRREGMTPHPCQLSFPNCWPQIRELEQGRVSWVVCDCCTKRNNFSAEEFLSFLHRPSDAMGH